MLVLPLLSVTYYLWLDRLLCSVIAVSMFALGARLAMAQGRMLLMSFNGDVSQVVSEIETENSVVAVEEARFWRAHYSLCMANLKIRVRGNGLPGMVEDTSMGKLRERISGLIKNRLGGVYGKGGGVNWEVTIQLTVDER